MKREEFEKQIGKNIRAARLAAGLTQEQLAEKVDISSSFLSRVENGMSMPSITTVGDLAEKLGILPEKLMAVSTDYVISDDIDSQLLYLIRQSTKQEKKHLCKYISLLKELRTEK